MSKVSDVVGACHVYQCQDIAGTKVDMVLPLSYKDEHDNKHHVRMTIKTFSGTGHESKAYEYASKLGASSVALYKHRIVTKIPSESDIVAGDASLIDNIKLLLDVVEAPRLDCGGDKEVVRKEREQYVEAKRAICEIIYNA